MLQRSNPKPLYQQLEEIINEKIATGEWKPHAVIPSENELSRIYGLSRMTVRSVLTNFVKRGMLYRVQGKGTFVSEPKISAEPMSYVGLREQLEIKGFEIQTRILSLDRERPSEHVASVLKVALNSEVVLLERLRFIKNEPISLHTTYIPAGLCEDLEGKNLAVEQLCVILDRDYGLKRTRTEESLESTLATEREAELLCVKAAHPLLLLEDIISTSPDTPFEYSKILFRGDRMKLKFQFDFKQP